MPDQYSPPSQFQTGYHCPHCGIHSQQIWAREVNGAFGTFAGLNTMTLNGYTAACCTRCKLYQVWFDGKLVYPLGSAAPLPADDMPDDVKADYTEARSILGFSPRGAAALVRLALQRLMLHLGEKGTNLNDDIGSLVSKGLPIDIQKALDSLRVIGNNAVHPGQIDLRDDLPTAAALFELLNLVVESTITQPKKIQELYSKLPQAALAQIQRRDNQP